MEAGMSTADVYLKNTDKDGGVSYTQHRAWDVELFARNAADAAHKAGGGKAERITQEDYRAATGWGKNAKR